VPILKFFPPLTRLSCPRIAVTRSRRASPFLSLNRVESSDPPFRVEVFPRESPFFQACSRKTLALFHHRRFSHERQSQRRPKKVPAASLSRQRRFPRVLARFPPPCSLKDKPKATASLSQESLPQRSTSDLNERPRAILLLTPGAPLPSQPPHEETRIFGLSFFSTGNSLNCPWELSPFLSPPYFCSFLKLDASFPPFPPNGLRLFVIHGEDQTQTHVGLVPSSLVNSSALTREIIPCPYTSYCIVNRPHKNQTRHPRTSPSPLIHDT